MAEAFWAEQVAKMSHALQSLSEVSERLASGVKDHVLFAGSVKLLDVGNGTVFAKQFEFGATCGSAEIFNPGANLIVVQASTQQGNIPQFGQGTYRVPTNTWRLVNIGQRVFTVYSTAADIVGVQALTTGGVYGAGSLV